MRKKLFLIFSIFAILLISSSITTYTASYFDESDLSSGLIYVTYESNNDARIKLIVEKDSARYIYDVNREGIRESFPLQLGDGEYKLSLLQNTSGSSYKFITTKVVNLELSAPEKVFLNSIQNVNWNIDSNAVKKAVDLTKGTNDLQKKANILWKYMANDYNYDYNKLAKLQSSYVPVIDLTLKDKSGICYDFTSLYAAMLRSQGIPAKLIKGYAPENAQGYHSWNEVYDSSTKKWLTIDPTYDLQIIKKNPGIVSMIKNSSKYQKIYEY